MWWWSPVAGDRTLQLSVRREWALLYPGQRVGIVRYGGYAIGLDAGGALYGSRAGGLDNIVQFRAWPSADTSDALQDDIGHAQIACTSPAK